MSGRDTRGSLEARRWVTVLCVQACASPSAEPTTQGAVPDGSAAPWLQVLERVVAASGGLLQLGTAGAWWGVFGLSEAGERSAMQATEAALALQQADAVPPAWRFGIHGGLAVVQDAGPGGDGPQVLGRVPELAAALCQRAEAGAILVSEETLGPFVYAFSTHALGVWALPGVSLSVRRVLGRQGSGARIDAARTRGMARFAGRAQELQVLRRALADTQGGVSRCCVLRAPPGSGKTRLAAEFLREARSQGCHVLQGDCAAGLKAVPLQPFKDLLRRQWPLQAGSSAAALQAVFQPLLGHAGTPGAASALAALLAMLDPVGAASAPRDTAGDDTDGRQALVLLMQGWARRARLVLFIDDWQWADDASRDLLQRLLAQPELAVLVLLATRPTPVADLGLASAQTLALAPLGEAEALQAIAELLPGGEPFVLQDVLRWSGGNPLFIEELCHHVVRHHRLPHWDGHGGEAWIENLTAARLAALPHALRQVLDAAAVVGMVQPVAALTYLVGSSSNDPRFAALAAQDLLYPDGSGEGFRFKHELTRRVVDATMDGALKQHLHRRMAAWLNPGDDPQLERHHCEALAHHWAAAGEHARAARCGEWAGTRAMANSAVDLAKMQFRAVLDMLDHLPDTPERYQAWRSAVRRYGLACVFDPGSSEVAVFQRALRAAQDHGDQRGAAYAEYWTAYARYALGRHRQALLHVQACIGMAQAVGDRLLLLQAQALLAQNHAAMGQAGWARTAFDTAVPAIMALQASGAPVGPGLSYVLACQAQLWGDQGRFVESEQAFAQALEAAPGSAHEVNGSVLCLRACVRLWAGRHADAAADALAAEHIGARVRSLYLYAMGRALGARAQWCLSPGRVAVQAIAEASAWMQGHGQQLFNSLTHGWLAEAAAEAGDAATARLQLALALQRARGGDSLGLPMALRAQAHLAAHHGQAAKAWAQLALADRIARRRLAPHELQANEALRRSLPGLRQLQRQRR